MRYLTGLIFEYQPRCNLATEHRWCPSWSRLKHSPPPGTGATHLTTDKIVELTLLAREFGFDGLVGFHYYNEPMLEWNRLLGIMARLEEQSPPFRFILWTNGTYIRPDMAKDLARFEVVVVTNHTGLDLGMIWAMCPGVELVLSTPDDRLTARVDSPLDDRTSPCLRPMTEFVIDYWGEVHLCCYDWRAQSGIGNVLTDDPADCITRWQQARDAIVTAWTIGDLPEACRHCTHRDYTLQSYCSVAGWRAIQYTDRLRSDALRAVHA